MNYSMIRYILKQCYMLRGNLSSASGSNSRYLSGKGRLFISDYRTCLYADWFFGQNEENRRAVYFIKMKDLQQLH